MPEISRFLGIVIRMYFEEHPPPHFHASYGDREAWVAVRPLAVLRSELSPRVLSLVLEWAAAHQDELAANWRAMRAGQPPQKIEPLS
ncbi:MAG: DUF4160 domain-containing protein [Deltaproteobacteria bacterium]|nr:DUF4160 domain-containing protein [Deltaproteobacteria bacterium]